jgi:tetratricopeptide (TPR) repeat protein
MSLSIDKALRQAQSHLKARELAEAESLYKQVLSKFPKNKKAIQGYQKLKAGITSKGSLGNEPPQEQVDELISFYNQGRFDKVLSKAKPLTGLFPKAVTLHNLQGASNAALHRYDAAIDSYRQAIKIKPDYADAYSNMGVILKNKGDLDAAIENYKQAIKIKPDFAEAYNNMGIALKNKGDLDAAIENCKQAIKINPDYADAYYNMGKALEDKGELDGAIDSYKQAIKINPDYADAYSNMGIALTDKGDLEAAIDSCKQAIKIKPDYAEAYSNMGVAQRDKGDLDAAIESYKQAIKIKPELAEAHHNLSFAFLNSGRLNEGLDEYEWRWRTADLLSKGRHFSQPLWDGIKDLKGKRILLWCEQGPGDMVIWSSCLLLMASQAEYCILECQEKLVALFARSFPNVEVKAENRSLDTERDDFDFHLPMGSLFRHFISEISQDTKPNSFLVPDPVRVNFWRERLNSLGKDPYVGISWKSPDMTPKRLPNYTQISDWAPVLTLPNVTFINLQSSNFAGDLTAIQNEFGVTVHNFDDLDQYDDLDDVAALSAALDFAVSVATAAPTITAGVGTPTKLAAWRQSSWNNILLKPLGPSVDVFERNTWESWDNVFRSIAENIISCKIMRRNN